MVCPCMLDPQGGGRRMYKKGGYRPTRRNKALLKRYKAGQSIGFTGRASLKAKGMIPRSSGKYILGPKYSGTGRPKVLSGPTRKRRAH